MIAPTNQAQTTSQNMIVDKTVAGGGGGSIDRFQGNPIDSDRVMIDGVLRQRVKKGGRTGPEGTYGHDINLQVNQQY